MTTDTQEIFPAVDGEVDEQLSEVLALIDRGLGEMLHREIVSTDEVADLLLDVRSLLTSDAASAVSEN